MTNKTGPSGPVIDSFVRVGGRCTRNPWDVYQEKRREDGDVQPRTREDGETETWRETVLADYKELTPEAKAALVSGDEGNEGYSGDSSERKR